MNWDPGELCCPTQQPEETRSSVGWLITPVDKQVNGKKATKEGGWEGINEGSWALLLTPADLPGFMCVCVWLWETKCGTQMSIQKCATPADLRQTRFCLHRWMDGWSDGWIDGWMDGWLTCGWMKWRMDWWMTDMVIYTYMYMYIHTFSWIEHLDTNSHWDGPVQSLFPIDSCVSRAWAERLGTSQNKDDWKKWATINILC